MKYAFGNINIADNITKALQDDRFFISKFDCLVEERLQKREPFDRMVRIKVLKFKFIL